MAGDEDQAQEIVAHVIVDLSVKIRLGELLLNGEFPPQLLVLALEAGVPAQQINGPVFGRAHQPDAGIARHARLRPLLQRRDQRILRQILGDTNIAHNACEASDEPGRLYPPDCVD